MTGPFASLLSWHAGRARDASPPALADTSEISLARVSAATRTVLALAVCLVVFELALVAPAAMRTPQALAALYALNAITLLYLAIRGQPVAESIEIFWGDAAWFILLAAASGDLFGTFLFFLFFPVLGIAFRWGAAQGAALALVCALVLAALAIAGWNNGPHLAPGKLFLIAGSVAVVGFLVVDLAKSGLEARRRLALLSRLSAVAEPSLGLRGMSFRVLAELSRHCDADVCALVLAEPAERTATLFQVCTGLPETSRQIDESLLGPLLVREDTVIAHDSSDRCRPIRLGVFSPGDPAGTDADPTAQGAAAANLLDCSALVSVPIRRRGRPWGRLFVGSTNGWPATKRPHPWLLAAAAEQLAPALDNGRLLELALGESADRELKRISLDLHDLAIQPYLGLKFGLEALLRKAPPRDPLKPDIERLAALANQEIAALRAVVREMRHGTGGAGTGLFPAVQRQATLFAELFGIEITVDIDCGAALDEALGAELFTLVAEALNNVTRHTRSASAAVRISCTARAIRVEVANLHDPDAPPPPFAPRSIGERVRQLGGALEIDVGDDGRTRVIATIPFAED